MYFGSCNRIRNAIETKLSKNFNSFFYKRYEFVRVVNEATKLIKMRFFIKEFGTLWSRGAQSFTRRGLNIRLQVCRGAAIGAIIKMMSNSNFFES